MNEFQCWMVVDADGNYTVGESADDAATNYSDAYCGGLATRVVCVTVKMECPGAVRAVVELPREECKPVVTIVAGV